MYARLQIANLVENNMRVLQSERKSKKLSHELNGQEQMPILRTEDLQLYCECGGCNLDIRLQYSLCTFLRRTDK